MDRDGVEIEFHTNAFVVFFNIIDDDEFAAFSFGDVAVEGEGGIDGGSGLVVGMGEGRRGAVVVGYGAFQGDGGRGRDGGGSRKRINTIR